MLIYYYTLILSMNEENICIRCNNEVESLDETGLCEECSREAAIDRAEAIREAWD